MTQHMARSCRKDTAAPEWNPKAGSLAAARRKPALPEQKALQDFALRNGAAAAAAVAALTDAALHSRAHDAYGLLQMPPSGVPGLADVVHVMLAAYALLDNFLLVRPLPSACSPRASFACGVRTT